MKNENLFRIVVEITVEKIYTNYSTKIFNLGKFLGRLVKNDLWPIQNLWSKIT